MMLPVAIPNIWVFSDRKFWPKKQAKRTFGSGQSENFSPLRYHKSRACRFVYQTAVSQCSNTESVEQPNNRSIRNRGFDAFVDGSVNRSINCGISDDQSIEWNVRWID